MYLGGELAPRFFSEGRALLSNQCKIDPFLAKFAQKIPEKSAVFYQLFFGEVSLENLHKISAKSADVSMNLFLKIPQNCQKPWLYKGQSQLCL